MEKREVLSKSKQEIKIKETELIRTTPAIHGFIKCAKALGVFFFLIGVFFVMGAFFEISITIYSVSNVKTLASVAGILLEVIGVVLLVIKIKEPVPNNE